MKVAYFDCAFGAAGDMLLGSLIDAGLDLSELERQLRLLNLPQDEFQLSVSKVHRSSLLASHFNVKLKSAEMHSHSHDHGHSHEHGHEHSHTHAHTQEHGHTHSHEHSHTHEHTHEHSHDHTHDHRSLSTILALIENSKLEMPVKQLASRIFKRLGVAESKVHGVSIEDIHFHEVGAVDAIVDIIGFSIAYHMLGIEQVYVSPLPLGGGTVRSAHGLFPVPGPATINLIAEAGAPTRAFAVNYECLTPTGAAILTTCAHGYGGAPAFEKIAAIGYGAGTLDPAGHPNVVRVVLGEAKRTVTEESCISEIVACLETNIDDCSPQVLAFTAETLLAEGALDVSITACLMKKGRSGHKLTVVAPSALAQSLTKIILRETTSLGVRSYMCERLTLEREFVQVKVNGEVIRVKVARDKNGQVLNMQPEYEDCARLAKSSGQALKSIIMAALSLAQESFVKEPTNNAL